MAAASARSSAGVYPQNGSTPRSQSPPPPSQHRRGYQACDPCRKRKVKCDLKNGSKLFENSYHNEEDFGNLLEESKKLLIENNYEPYYLYRQKKSVISSENIGYAKKDHSSIYNIVMMEELENIIGFGLGASTKIF